MLVGLPGSGKSTYPKQIIISNPDVVIISLDDLIDQYALDKGITYAEAWNKVNFKEFNASLKARLAQAITDKKDILVDKTNMTVKVRGEVLKKITSDYHTVAYVFVIPDNVLQERLDKRAASTGKVIPAFVIKNMANSYVSPSKEEFDEIKYIRL
jgi:predicted kinase